MALNSIEKEWKRYAEMIFDGMQPSATQIEETKRAFYAGNFSLFVAVAELSEPHVTEDQAAAFLSGREQECHAFNDELYARTQQTEPARLEDMTEPQLKQHIGRQMEYLKFNQTPDTIGTMLIIFQDNGITQYGATIMPEDAPAALRELADRLERRDTVTR